LHQCNHATAGLRKVAGPAAGVLAEEGYCVSPPIRYHGLPGLSMAGREYLAGREVSRCLDVTDPRPGKLSAGPGRRERFKAVGHRRRPEPQTCGSAPVRLPIDALDRAPTPVGVFCRTRRRRSEVERPATDRPEIPRHRVDHDQGPLAG
jgi:hypothetical protein